MFTSTLRSSLLALAVSVLAVNASQSISLKVSGPESVDTVDNLKVKTTLTNTGDETLKLLNDPLSPLSQLPANTFKITGGLQGASPIFTGIKAKYVPAVAAAQKAYTVLAPGESVDVNHDLSTVYNFIDAGEGLYSFEARNHFYVVDDSAEITSIYADVEAHTAHISGKLSARRPLTEKRATYNGCSSSQQSGLVSAASAAQSYAASALSYLTAHTSSTARFTTWFGTYSSAHHTTVQSHFSKISSNTFSSFTYDCTCTDAGTYAFVDPSDFGHIFLCGAFWQAPNTGTDSRGGTLIHESSHFTVNGGTDDHVYGQAGCKQLAISDPTSAIDNADSHEYFAENNPAQS